MWSAIIHKQKHFVLLSPADLDSWPSQIDMGHYIMTLYESCHDSPQLFPHFSHPYAVLQPVFRDLGWYHTDASLSFHHSMKPLFEFLPWKWLHSEEEELKDENTPSLDKDAVWEPAIYPPEWPPYPAPTWKAAWDAAEAEYKAEEKKKKEESEKRWWKSELGLASGNGGIRQLVREKLCGGDVVESENIEMV